MANEGHLPSCVGQAGTTYCMDVTATNGVLNNPDDTPLDW